MVAFVVTVMLLVVRLGIVFMQAWLTRACERDERRRLLRHSIAAGWATHADEPPGRLQAVTGFASIYADRLALMLNAARVVFTTMMLFVGAFLVEPVGALLILVVGGVMFRLYLVVAQAARKSSTRSGR